MPAGYARSKSAYPQEQNWLAVEHYPEHGRRISATIKALGYPGRVSLHSWVRELRPEAHPRIVGRSGDVSPGLKQAAVIALCTRQESAQKIADQLGVCRTTLYNWKNELLGREVVTSMKRNRNSPSFPEREVLERQLEELRRQVRRLQLEQDVLTTANELIKKGTGIDPQLLSNREKTMLVDDLKQTYALRADPVSNSHAPSCQRTGQT